MSHIGKDMAETESFFCNRVISKGLWPPRSPDLTPPDFFLWGMLKGKVYRNKPRTEEDLKENIKCEIAAIPPETLADTFRNMECSIEMCLPASHNCPGYDIKLCPTCRDFLGVDGRIGTLIIVKTLRNSKIAYRTLFCSSTGVALLQLPKRRERVKSPWEPHPQKSQNHWRANRVKHVGDWNWCGAEASSAARQHLVPNLRQPIRVGVWNFLSLQHDDCLPLLLEELCKLCISVAALSELYRIWTGQISVDADLQIGELQWGDSGVYYCKVVVPDDLMGQNEDKMELLVLGKTGALGDLLPNFEVEFMPVYEAGKAIKTGAIPHLPVVYPPYYVPNVPLATIGPPSIIEQKRQPSVKENSVIEAQRGYGIQGCIDQDPMKVLYYVEKELNQLDSGKRTYEKSSNMSELSSLHEGNSDFHQSYRLVHKKALPPISDREEDPDFEVSSSYARRSARYPNRINRAEEQYHSRWKPRSEHLQRKTLQASGRTGSLDELEEFAQSYDQKGRRMYHEPNQDREYEQDCYPPSFRDHHYHEEKQMHPHMDRYAYQDTFPDDYYSKRGRSPDGFYESDRGRHYKPPSPKRREPVDNYPLRNSCGNRAYDNTFLTSVLERKARGRHLEENYNSETPSKSSSKKSNDFSHSRSPIYRHEEEDSLPPYSEREAERHKPTEASARPFCYTRDNTHQSSLHLMHERRDREKFRKMDTAYAVWVRNFEIWIQLPIPNVMWETFRDKTLKVAEGCVGVTGVPRRRCFILQGTPVIIERNRSLRLSGNSGLYRELRRRAARALRADKKAASNTVGLSAPPITALITPEPVRHCRIPDLPLDGSLLFEFLFFIYLLVALFVQYINIYKTIWWYPYSHPAASTSLNFYLIDYYLAAFITVMLARRLVWTIISEKVQDFINANALIPKPLQIKGNFGVYVPLCCFHQESRSQPLPAECGYLDQEHIDGQLIKSKDFLTLLRENLKEQFNNPTSIPAHTCPLSPDLIRNEVECLKGDFNKRIKEVLFNSLFSAYYVAFLPLCFVKSTQYYDMRWSCEHLIMVWINAFVMLMSQLLPPKYCDLLHRSAAHLGKWQKLEHGSYSNAPQHV
ncbi:TM39A protein, partial [Polypterus senegalus]